MKTSSNISSSATTRGNRIKQKNSSEIIPNDQSQNNAKTQVQFIPIKASPEIISAICRFRNTTGVFYDNHLTLASNCKPNLRTVNRRCHLSSSGHHLLTSSHIFDFNKTNYKSSPNSCRNPSSYNGRRCPSNSYQSSHYFQRKNDTEAETNHIFLGLSTGWRGGHSDICNRQNKMATISYKLNSNEQNFRFRDRVNDQHCTVVTSPYPWMTYKHPSNMERCLTSDILTLCSKKDHLLGQFRGNKRTSDTDELSRKEILLELKNDPKNVQFSTTSVGSVVDDNFTIYQNKDPISSTERDFLQEHHVQPKATCCNSGETSSLHDRLNEMSCVKFADSILAAVDADLNKVYQICQRKIRYSERIEMSHPDLFEEYEYNKWRNEKQEQFVSFSASNCGRNLMHLSPQCKTQDDVQSFKDPSLPTFSTETLNFTNVPNTVSQRLSSKVCRSLSKQELTRGQRIFQAEGKDDELANKTETQVTVKLKEDDSKYNRKVRPSILKSTKIDMIKNQLKCSKSRETETSFTRARCPNVGIERKHNFTIENRKPSLYLKPTRKSAEYFHKVKGRVPVVRFSSDNQIHELSPLESETEME